MSSETKQFVSDSILAIALVGLLFFVVNPLHIWMPSQVEMMLSAVFAAVFGIFIALFWREQPRDEREEAHAAFSGRVAFFVGTTTIALGIVYQSLQHSIDWWLPTVLVVMIVSKYIARMYAQSRR